MARPEPRSPKDLAQFIRDIPEQETLRRVIDKSIAISSGKGGVGKTITACNLAISWARKDLRVGLVDLDPLSDVASLLDLYESEEALRSGGNDGRDPSGGLQAQLLPVFRGLEILFPFQKLAAAEVGGLMEKIYLKYLREIDGRYDVLLFDMPAGMSFEDNLAYLPFMKRLVLVTNPEPTAHASAGAYAKEVQRLFPGKTIQLWHNRYSSLRKEGFHPSDVAGNYNRFVDPSDRLSPQEGDLLQDFAFVPEDPALDLLQGEPNPAVHVLKCMRESLDYTLGRLLSHASRGLGVSPRIADIVTFYIQRNPRIEDVDGYLAGLGEYLDSLVRSVAPDGPLFKGPPTVFSEEESKALRGFIHRVKASALRREILRLDGLLSDDIKQMEEARGPFASRLPMEQDKALDRELGRFLMVLNRAARSNAVMRKHGALLLFYFSLHKLFQSKTLLGVLKSLIPRRTDRGGRKVRDRFRQIRTLVEQDPQYRGRYLKTMRTLFFVVRKQLAAIAETLELGDLFLRDRGSQFDARAYLKLLAAFLHETLYSGLSVIVGFDYRSAAAAFQDGAERLLASLALTASAASPRRESRPPYQEAPRG